MRIAIDCRWITTDNGGIRNYTLNLVKNLLIFDSMNQYLLVYDKEPTKKVILDFILHPAVNGGNRLLCEPNFLKFDYSPFSIKSQVLLPGILNKNKIDVFHSTNFMVPLFGCNCKLVITLHDLIPYLFPQWCYKSKKIKVFWLYKKLTEFVVNRVDKIVTDSENSRKDIIRSFSKVINKVQTVYIGYNDNLTKINDENRIKEFKKKVGFPGEGKFILYIGRQDPSKNLIGLVKSFIKLCDKIDDVYLVIVGKKDDRYPEPYDLIKQHNLERKIIFPGILFFEEINLIYNSCDIFVFPSFYEGFGLPPIEAMACGLPVICSNTSSLPEVAGDAALLVNPDNVNELTENMYKLLGDGKLRQVLIEKGFQQVKKFSWEKAAKEMVKVYEKLRI